MANPLLEIKQLKTTFSTLRGKVTAVDGVSFSVKQDEILGIVGESGCGKSVTSQSVMRLYDEKRVARHEGEVLFDGCDLLKLSEKEMRKIRGGAISMIFQDALSSLNPVFTIGSQIAEAIRSHQPVCKKAALSMAEKLLETTGIPEPAQRMKAYPHELSGGMRQRAMIAMALACRPRLLIADEPTTALDVTIQAQIMDLISGMRDRLHMGVILITHDLGVVAQTCNRVVVMYLGQVVEEGTVKEIFDSPRHPYTIGLRQSIPTLKTDKKKPLATISGTVPSMGQVGAGCRFYERCPYAVERCHTEPPTLATVSDSHRVRCWRG